VGKAGATVAGALAAAGAPPVVLWERSGERADLAARALGLTVVSGQSPPLALAEADAWLLAVPDGALGELAEALASTPGLLPPQVVLHLSGALDSTPLAPLAADGTTLASLHPARALPDPLSSARAHDPTGLRAICAARLQACPFGLLADDERGAAAATSLAETLGGHVVRLAPGGKVSYHAACVLASNGLVTLLDAAARLAAPGLEVPAQGVALMVGLAASTVHAVAQRGPAGALTGPVARGDSDTVAAHLQALAGTDERALYLALAEATLALARRAPTAGEPLRAIGEVLQRARTGES